MAQKEKLDASTKRMIPLVNALQAAVIRCKREQGLSNDEIEAVISTFPAQFRKAVKAGKL